MKKYFMILAVICLAALACVPIGATAFAEENLPEYEIYPTPHSVTYLGTKANVTSIVNLQVGSDVDESTVAHLYDALSQIGVLSGDSGTKVYVGVYGSNDNADKFAAENIAFSEGLFDKIDAYLLAITTKAILVLGKDTDAAYYGITTLKAILSQSGKSVQCMMIEDWSDSLYRGFIEGYYGIPWTSDQRVELMRFGSQFKTNMYIYAPKDDPYHAANWRGLYSEADLVELKEQIAAGTETKTRFVWAIHPFMNQVFKRANYETDLQVLLAKFEQLYQAGVRQFALSADDIETSALDTELQRDLCNDIVKWMEQKGDCYNLIFVPTVYWWNKPVADGGSDYSTNAQYFEKLMGSGDNALSPNVEIMWTGQGVCSTVANGQFDIFTSMTGRKAFMWMNWPVNDYTYTSRDESAINPYILMGKGEVFNVTLEANQQADFSGIVVNPLQYAEASKLSIFACADYTWNINGFDQDDSYDACFKYLDSACGEQLRELCLHIANPNSKFGGELWFEESVDLQKAIESYQEALGGDGEQSSLANLLAQLDKIDVAATQYLQGAANQKLLEEMKPFAQSLGYIAQSAKKLLEIRHGISQMSTQVLGENIDLAEELFAAAGNCKTVIQYLGTYTHRMYSVHVGPKVLTPFVKQLLDDVKEEAYMVLGRNTGCIWRGFNGIYQGAIENVFDGDIESYVWFDGTPHVGDYVRVDLGEEVQLGSLQILSGKPDGGDAWYGYVEYSLDGKTFTKIGDFSGAQVQFDLRDEPVSARFIRVVAAPPEGRTNWMALREVEVNNLTDSDWTLKYENFTWVSGDIATIIDGDEDTGIWFDWKYSSESYVLIDMRVATDITAIQLLLGSSDHPNDYPHNNQGLQVSYSTDGINFTNVGPTVVGTDVTIEQLITARYIKISGTAVSDYGLVIREVKVN